MKSKIIVLGAGPAGISAAYHLKELGLESIVFEKKDDYGGLCGGFDVDGFSFDIFAHMAFFRDKEIKDFVDENVSTITHSPEAMNYCDGDWVRNPVQMNLKGLPVEKRIKVITDFVERDKNREITDYEDWLLKSYGRYFTENYPNRYTRKYWTVEAKQLEPKWINNRMYQPTLEEVLEGAFKSDTPNVHYSKEMYYPEKGGFKGFLDFMVEKLDIRLNKEVSKIDFEHKKVEFTDGELQDFDVLISTLPIDRIGEFCDEVPDEVITAAESLDHTSGYIVSLGFDRVIDFPYVWFYIYDEDIYPARVYFSNKKHISNAPEGCSSIQAEVHTSKYKLLEMDKQELMDRVIAQLSGTGLFKTEEVVVKDIRYEEYANVMFTPPIYKSRKTILDYLKLKGVYSIGRFGEWDYLWIEQCIRNGKKTAEEIYRWSRN